MDWPGKAEALGALIEKTRLHPRVVEKLAADSAEVGVACSGGLDSLAALLLLYVHFPAIRSRTTVLHFNHQLRRKASDEEAAFVQRVADGLGLPLKTAAWTERNRREAVSEAQARQARQAFFDEFVVSKVRALIVTGHQQNDILETLMLRIARASNITGLAAPKPVSAFPGGKTMLRPLLNLPKETLRTALLSAGIEWKEDRSNLQSRFDRNRLRNEVIPVWQAASQFDLVQAAAQVREYLEEAEEVLERHMAFSRYPPPGSNPVQLPVRLGPKGVLRRWVYQWLREHDLLKSGQTALVAQVLDVLMRGDQARWSLGDGFLSVDGTQLAFEKARDVPPVWTDPLPLKWRDALVLPTGSGLASEPVCFSRELLDKLDRGKYSEYSTVLIDSECLHKDSLLVRPWMPGDQYQPLNAPGRRKLQDMFVDRKISREERISLPVVITTDSIILWCPGLPVNHAFRVSEKTKQILQLTYNRLH